MLRELHVPTLLLWTCLWDTAQVLNGAALSGGQRQRVAIARAILSRPRMLILDEATSALGPLTERTVCENLRRELSGDTVFFIAHRLSTIRSADSIMLMENGCTGGWYSSTAPCPQGLVLRSLSPAGCLGQLILS